MHSTIHLHARVAHTKLSSPVMVTLMTSSTPLFLISAYIKMCVSLSERAGSCYCRLVISGRLWTLQKDSYRAMGVWAQDVATYWHSYSSPTWIPPSLKRIDKQSKHCSRQYTLRRLHYWSFRMTRQCTVGILRSPDALTVMADYGVVLHSFRQ